MSPKKADLASVRTPDPDKRDDVSLVQADGTIKQIVPARAGIRDLTSTNDQNQAEKKTSKMNNFITNLMKKDRHYYERLVDLMRYFNQIDVDLKSV